MTAYFQARLATAADLDAINNVIEAAVMSWDLPERVRRLALPGYLYGTVDFEHLEMVVAETDGHGIIGVAAWEQADPVDTPEGVDALLLHGIYVDPAHHGRGVGSGLFAMAEQAVLARHYEGLLVRAWQDAAGFFTAQGMHALPVADASRDYVHRFWKRTAI